MTAALDRHAGYPHFAAFVLFAAACLAGLLLSPSQDMTGFVWLGFCLFSLARMTWLLDARARQNGADDAQGGMLLLPRKILSVMSLRHQTGLAPLIAESFDRRLTAAAVLCGLWLLLALLSSARGPFMPSFLAQQDRIAQFWAMAGLPLRPDYDPLWQDRLAALGVLFLRYGFAEAWPATGGFGFWQGQGWGSHAMLQRAGLVAPYAAPAFMVRVFETGWAASLLLAALTAYAALMPLRHAYTGRTTLAAAMPGPCLGLVFLLCDLLLPADAPLPAVWLCLWMMLGAVWMRTGHGQRKSYVMHQV